jgi:hypothetical protein
LWFALAVFLLDLALEAMTFEMPFSREWGVWKGELLLHFVAVVTVSICASAGGLIWLLPGLTVFAFIVVQSVGRWVAARDAQP